MDINVKGVWYGCKHAVAAMRKNKVDESKGLQRGGSIITVASFVALMGAATPQLACQHGLFVFSVMNLRA
jgi:NAD(P)-dependent dehydrogenase (short-subunit alcohol dehydrogenase family)